MLALVQDGDEIVIDIHNRKLELIVDERMLQERRKKWIRPEKIIADGYLKIYQANSMSAAEGAVMGGYDK